MSDQRAPTVVIADDHALTRDALQRLLETQGIVVAGAAADGLEAIELARRHMPDLAVLDHMMPGADGLEAAREIGRWSPSTRIAIVTGNPRSGMIRTIAESGVAGLFLKSEAPDAICDGLLQVLAGGTVLSAGVAGLIGRNAGGAALTARELAVLKGLGAGLTNTQVAGRLHISPKTVENHRAALMRKLDVNCTASLIMRAVEEGFLEPGV